jgi:glutamate synthase (NADPH) large chain
MSQNVSVSNISSGLYVPEFEHDACGVGFVAHLKGKRTHDIVRMGLQILDNLVHRGACGCDPETGDGAGILLQLPHEFFIKEAQILGFDLPEAGEYGVAMVFLPKDPEARAECERIIERVVRIEGQQMIGWRDVPVRSDQIGNQAQETEPFIRQCFIGRGRQTHGGVHFERRLYIIRKSIEREVLEATGIPDNAGFYIPSLSTKTMIYKGLLLPHQMRAYYLDLTDTTMVSAIALVHQRFSTNTFPSWPLAHPYRMLAHNGEINTIRGNRNWMRAREAGLTSAVFGDDLQKIYPLVSQEGSDSGTLDNAVELLTMGGRTLAEAMMVLMPEAWDGNDLMTPTRRAFYEYHACLMEPWDGPAAVAFTDGVQIGAVLDRNGLRPGRYTVTTDDLVILASETGVIEVPAANILERGRLQPGRMFLVDTIQGRIIPDDEIKDTICNQHPYGDWLVKNRIDLATLTEPKDYTRSDHATLLARQKAFGFTFEEVRMLIQPAAQNGEEALGSMGTDTPLAVLSHRPLPLYNYFKQLFAQVTNPPIDPIRESMVMSLAGYIGPSMGLMDEEPGYAQQIKLTTPILSNKDLQKLLNYEQNHQETFVTGRLPMVFPTNKPTGSLERALERLCWKASDWIEKGAHVLILTDRELGPDYAPIPALLALSAVHHHLIKEGTRTAVALIVETGEAREIHHMACLLGYGASAVNPYLCFETISGMIEEGILTDIDFRTAQYNFIKAMNKGLLKVMSKMGISTMQSYRGAQIFEAVGISKEVIDKYFVGTPSRIQGIGLEHIEQEMRGLHEYAYPKTETSGDFPLEPGGQYQWRRYGEYHAYNPTTIDLMQKAVRNLDTKQGFATFQEFSQAVNDSAKQATTLRGLMQFKYSENPIPINEVEPAKEIVKRFATGAMSLGSISRESHEQLAIAMNRIGGMSNTGEGGEDPVRFTDNRRSKIKQVASGRFGVTTHYLVNADELQIKMAQGAKPGEGGQLPGYKVSEYIAKVRHTTPGVTLISPPPHHDIYSIEDLAQLIFDLKNVNPEARISVKLVAEVGVGTVAAGVAKAHADHILVSGYEGGTGASPQSSIKHAGLPWELGVAETQQVLVMNNLRGRVRLQADGQLKTGRDVVVAALLGAEEFGFSSAPLVAQGCIMMRVCHLGTCPVGIATQDEELRKKFNSSPENVINFFFFVAEEVRQIMAKLGIRTVDELVGRADLLEVEEAVRHWKAKNIDIAHLLMPLHLPGIPTRCVEKQDHGLEGALDYRLIERAKAALEDQRPVQFRMPIFNHNRTCGTMLSGQVAKHYGAEGLPADTIQIQFHGSAGQSFGAFLAPGLSLTLEGDANDYLGKGMSGGRIVVKPPTGTKFNAAQNIIAGNTLLYGATKGEAYLNGMVGERFCVRNSGATAVVEGVGDHGCEYMTGGTVVILGQIGRNFAAGMSGGVAYVWNPENNFSQYKNNDPNLLEEPVGSEEGKQLKALIEAHLKYTGSKRAKELLANWATSLSQFVRVISKEYKLLTGK